MSKKILSIVLTISVFFGVLGPIPATAADRVSLLHTVVIKNGYDKFFADGVEYSEKDGIKLVDDTMFVSGNIIKHFLNVNSAVMQGEKLYVRTDKKTASFEAGKTTAFINGVSASLAKAPFSENGRVYVPVRAAAEAAECLVHWDKAGYVFICGNEKALESFKTEDSIAVMNAYFAGTTGGAAREKAEYASRTHDNAEYIYVKPGGKGDGSKESPFGSITEARNFIRRTNENQTCDIVVSIADGEYYIDEALEFTKADSGKNGFKVIYEAESGNAVISGGVKVNGWVKARGTVNTYKAVVNTDYVRQLYINDEKRSVVTSEGFYVTDMYKNKDGLYKSFSIENTVIPPDAYSGGMEIMTDIINWVNLLFPIETVKKYNDTHTEVVVKGDFYNQAATRVPFLDRGTLLYLRNAKFLLGKEGEWYFDPATKELFYTPLKGEDIRRVNAVVPKTEKLLDIRGKADGYVENLEFYGLDFKYCAWNDTSENIFRPFQAGELYSRSDLNEYSMTPAGVTVTYANNINFIRNKFEHFGAAVIGLDKKVKNSKVEGCVIYDAIDGGINIGNCRRRHERPTDDEGYFQTENITISNNLISNIGTEHYGAIAIMSYSSLNSKIVNNHIKEIPYTGISFGWIWKSTTEPTHRNMQVLNNLLESVCEKAYDGAGIYTLGRLEYSVISGNFIKRVGGPIVSKNLAGTSLANYGIYLDECSCLLTVENNAFEDNLKSMSAQKDNEDGTSRVRIANNWSEGTWLYFTRPMNTDVAKVVMEDGVREEPKIYDPANRPDEVEKIAANAGISDEFKDIEIEFESRFNKAPSITLEKSHYTGVQWDEIEVPAVISDDGVPFSSIDVEWKTDAAPEGSYMQHPRTKATVLTSVYVEKPQSTKGSKVTFALPGEYTLRICASDGEYTSEQEITFSIAPFPEDEYTDVAHGKSGWCSSTWNDTFKVEYATDGDRSTEFATANWNVAKEQEYLVIDLEDEYEVSQVVFPVRNTSEQDGPFGSFEIQLSDDPEFKTYYKVGGVGVKPDVPFGATWSKKVNSDKKYRYLRVRETKRNTCIVVPEIYVFVKK